MRLLGVVFVEGGRRQRRREQGRLKIYPMRLPCFLFPCALLFCVGSEMTNAQLSHRLLSKSEPINSREFSEQFKISSEIQQFPKQSSAQMISRINCFPAKMLWIAQCRKTSNGKIISVGLKSKSKTRKSKELTKRASVPLVLGKAGKRSESH